MRQTISKDHSNETLIQNQAIIIGAHCNSKIRKERCLKLLQEVKNRFGDDYMKDFWNLVNGEENTLHRQGKNTL